jgi:hypothetical protein
MLFPDPGSWLLIFFWIFFYPGSRGQKGTESRIRNTAWQGEMWRSSVAFQCSTHLPKRARACVSLQYKSVAVCAGSGCTGRSCPGRRRTAGSSTLSSPSLSPPARPPAPSPKRSYFYLLPVPVYRYSSPVLGFITDPYRWFMDPDPWFLATGLRFWI